MLDPRPNVRRQFAQGGVVFLPYNGRQSAMDVDAYLLMLPDAFVLTSDKVELAAAFGYSLAVVDLNADG